MKFSNQSNYENKKGRERKMSDERLKFMEMLSTLRVVDQNDRVRPFKDCVEQEFQEIAQKVSEYERDGKLIITINFKRVKKSKNAIDIFADVAKSIPKGVHKNMFYLDTRNGGLYYDNPDQGQFSVVKPFMKGNQTQTEE